MKSQDFSAWVELVAGGNKRQVQRLLGLSRSTIDKYLAEGAPNYIGLACAAIAFGLPAWKRPEWREDQGR